MGLCPSLFKAWATNKDGSEMETRRDLLQKAALRANKWAKELPSLFTKEKETLSNKLQRAKIFYNITSIVHWDDDFFVFKRSNNIPSIIFYYHSFELSFNCLVYRYVGCFSFIPQGASRVQNVSPSQNDSTMIVFAHHCNWCLILSYGNIKI